MSNITAYHVYETTAYDIDGVIYGEKEKENEFNDRVVAESGGRITEIRVGYGEVIDSIRFYYDYDLVSDTHGGSGGTHYQFTLEEDEHLIRMEWYTVYNSYYGGTVLAGIHFTTNKQRVFKAEGSFMYKYTNTYSFTAEDKHAIVGLKGYSDDYFNQITKVLCRQIDDNFEDDRFFYDDYYSLTNAKRLTKIVIHSGLVVDALQLVYDNDRSMTSMYGGTGGEYFEFPIDEDDYINKVKYHTGQVDYDGYGSSQVMLQLELWTKKGKYMKKGLYDEDLFDLDSATRSHISNYHVYSCTMKDGEELFCFAGVYSSYMGRILTVYNRLRSAKPSISTGQRNSDGKKYLFVCQINEISGGKPKKDPAVVGLVELMLRNYNNPNNFSTEQKNNIAFLPNVANSTELANSNVVINDDTFKKAVLSGQYTYISVRSHGTEAGCGNYGAGLMDVKWVRENKKLLASKLNNTVFNFNCCECGCRNTIEQYEGYYGLGRELINAGVRAVFAYTIAYLSVEKPLEIPVQDERAYYTKFYNLIDNKYIKLDETKDPEDIAEEIKKEYNRQLVNYTSILPNISALSGLDEITFSNNVELVRAFGKKLRKQSPNDYTAEGEPITTEGALDIRNALNIWLDKHVDRSISGMYKRVYSGYYNFYTNNLHLVGPGKKDPDPTLKTNNLGELCSDFSNWDGGEL